MRLADKIATMARRGAPLPVLVWMDNKRFSSDGIGYYSAVDTSILVNEVRGIVGHTYKIIFSDSGGFTSYSTVGVSSSPDSNKIYNAKRPTGNEYELIPTSEYPYLRISVKTDYKRKFVVTDETTGKVVIHGEDWRPALVSSRGGGTKCLTPRRSYRRLARPSARFCAHSHRWEVAA